MSLLHINWTYSFDQIDWMEENWRRMEARVERLRIELIFAKGTKRRNLQAKSRRAQKKRTFIIISCLM